LTNLAPLPRITLVIATGNPGKFREIAALMQDLPVLLLPLDRVGPLELPPESGESFQENARLKAVAVAAATGHLALADDSGLEVDALGGRPGVLSARYGGPGASDADRIALLLRELHTVPESRRTARFRCVIAIAEPAGPVHLAEGACEGRIGHAPRGRRGFGYDPIFEIPSLGKTFAEIDPEAKNRLSHRALALRGAKGIIEDLLRRRGSGWRESANDWPGG
jgi:XTP/dITP diphosphohydrolase